jgi:hypothetical protein
MLTNSTCLFIAGSLFGTICVSFGVNGIVRPQHALTFFEFDYPSTASEQILVDRLMIVYGARDIFMGIAIYATTYYSNRKALGWILFALSAVAFVDGAVCYANGHGQWNHWGYAPIVGIVGSIFIRN